MNNKSRQEVFYKRGQVVEIELEKGIGSEQYGKRPFLIIQNNIGNRYSPTIIGVLLTTKQTKANIPTHVSINALREPSVALCEQVRTVDKHRIIGNSRGGIITRLTDTKMKEIDKALRISMGL